MSLWGHTGMITVQLHAGELKNYFLKVSKALYYICESGGLLPQARTYTPSAIHQTASLGDTGQAMMRGEFESLRAMHAVSPTIVPEPYAWGNYSSSPSSSSTAEKGEETYYLLTEFREVGQQPPDPARFAARIAELHKTSVSPTGKFGFHTTTCHAKLRQITDCWEDSWAVLYRQQLAHMLRLDEEKHGAWPEFALVSQLVLDKVIPRLLEPLQAGGRSIKPCLVHGDLWDENTATDAATGEPFVFDAGAFYAHNEYEIGNWRAVRHRLSDRVYVESYLREFPPSEPGEFLEWPKRYGCGVSDADCTRWTAEEWDDRNLLYSLRFDLGCAILIPCSQRQV